MVSTTHLCSPFSPSPHSRYSSSQGHPYTFTLEGQYSHSFRDRLPHIHSHKHTSSKPTTLNTNTHNSFSILLSTYNDSSNQITTSPIEGHCHLKVCYRFLRW